MSVAREQALLDFIQQYTGVLVAYSGGLDSALVLWASVRALGPERVWAVTSDSESYASGEARAAQNTAREIGLAPERYLTIKTREIENQHYAANPPNRCYFCKAELFGELTRIAREKGVEVVFDGATVSDTGDYRPGAKAAEEFRVVSPLKEAGLDKEAIRAIARRHNLSVAGKAASACLASRIPHGIAVTAGRLRQIDRAESAVRKLGFDGFRVRYHRDVARLELRPEDIDRVLTRDMRDKIVRGIKDAGFRYVAVDLEGYRQGSLNPIEPTGEK
ncbi:MAG: ATP-dependent sacrificial sulfur transferase LarE [candidate division Zixibacteria bacterium]|nr:ATP-dependent sacrificial sulfur transferase LarE [candidate division Zixibacteria bacterium]